MSDEFDVVVIGAGPTGENLAERAKAGGLSVAIVEAELVGGECSYWACMPSKALLRPGIALDEARRLPGAHEAVGGGKLLAEAVLQRRDAFASHWKDDGQVGWLASVGLELVRGRARLEGERRVVVESVGPDGAADPAAGRRVLTARHAVAVCTGTRAALPEGLPGLSDARVWTSREATSAQHVPDRLAVVGGGVVALEMATAWRSLGSKVTLLIRGKRVLEGMEPFAGELVSDYLAESGVAIKYGVEVTALDRAPVADPDPDDEATEVTLTLSDGTSFAADEVLFAIGRRPATADLGLESVGLKPGSWLEVDETGRVQGVPGSWLYAAGDVNHRALLTHQGKYQGRIFGAVIADRAAGRALDEQPYGRSVATADVRAVPQVVFTNPEAAAVGLTLDAATRQGLRVRAVDYEIGSVAGASLYVDGYRGRARMVVDLDREVLVGASFVGPGVAELVHSATIAVAGEVPIDRLWHAVPSYPTISEVWLRLLETYRDEA